MLLATKIYCGFHVDCPTFLPIFNQICSLLTALSVGTGLIHADKADMMKLTGAFVTM
jgi:hypothetical protein